MPSLPSLGGAERRGSAVEIPDTHGGGMRKVRAGGRRTKKGGLSAKMRDRMIAEALVDAYGEEER
jgi:hypothetical protein